MGIYDIINVGNVDGVDVSAHALRHQIGGIDEVYSQAALDEIAQDAVGAALLDTSTVNLTYNDVSNQISADVIEAGLTLDNLNGTLGIAKGGTGQITQTLAFNALSPLTTAGAIIFHNGTNNVALVAGAAGQYLKMNATVPEWVSPVSGQVAITSTVTTTSMTPVVLTGMTFTLPAGTYLFMFSGDFDTQTNSQRIIIGMYNATVVVPGTTRELSAVSERPHGTLANQSILTLTDVSTIVDIRWYVSANTASCLSAMFSYYKL